MHTKKLTIVLGMLLGAGTLLAQSADQSAAPQTNPPAAAQGAPHARRPVDPAKQAKHLGKKLGLSSDQVSQITPIIADRQQQMQSLRADTSLSQQDRRARARSIMQDSNTKIEAVLNDPQKQQFEQMMQARRSHRQSAPAAQ